MNFAVIFAGGTGVRMNSGAIPKQFLRIHGKTILEHTVEHFCEHPSIDHVVVACLADWLPRAARELAHHAVVDRCEVVPGGDTSQQSIHAGLKRLEEYGAAEDSVVLIHDGVRPIIDEALISRNIDMVRAQGSSITVARQWETTVLVKDGKIEQTIDRDAVRVAKAPQGFYLREILEAHRKAIEIGRHDFIDSASLMAFFGARLSYVEGASENIKVTTASDYYMLRAALDARETARIFG